MRNMINGFTFNNPKELISPSIWLFIGQAYSIVPSVIAFLAIYILGAAFTPPYELDYTALIWLGVIGVISIVLHYIVENVSYYATYFKAYNSTADKRVAYIQKLRSQPLGFFNSKVSGELISSFGTDFSNVEFVMCYWLPYTFAGSALMLISFVFMLFFNYKMAIAMFFLIPVCAVLMFLAVRLKVRDSKQIMDAKTNAATQVNEYLKGMKDLKAYNRTGAGFVSMKDAYEDLRKASLKAEVGSGSLSMICALLTNFMVPVTIVFGIYFVIGGSLSIVDFAGFIIIATKLTEPAASLITCISMLRSMSLSGLRLNKVMNTLQLSGDKEIRNGDTYNFDNVEFSYNAGEKIIDGVSFDTKSNAVTALVGTSGGGKSTIIRLMARFWDNQSGVIAMNNNDVKDIHTDSLLSNISMVMQNTYLFKGTFRDNLCFGNDSITDEEMIDACKKAHCHKFITALPEGYDTIIGEGGATLSGGEKQRISLARAFLKDVPILLLDEPTASLDADNEAMVQQALTEISKNRTVIMIAHRLKTIRSADKILVIDKGKILEQGTHEELLSNNSLYANMWNLQSKASSLTF